MTYRVSHEIFTNAHKLLKEVRFVKSLHTGKWYTSIYESSLLIGKSESNLKAAKQRYYWEVERDGPALCSSKAPNIPLILYFPIDALVGLYCTGNAQQEELAPWTTSKEEISKYRGSKKKKKMRNDDDDFSSPPIRKRTKQSPAAAPAAPLPLRAQYSQIAHDWLNENKQVFREEAIKRLMLQDDVLQEAVSRVSNELSNPPEAKDVMDSFFK